MKLSILIISILLCCVVSANADYTYTIIDGYFEGVTLNDEETLLMTGGGGHSIHLHDYSQATILGTSPLIEGAGGLWELGMGGYTQLDFSGGEVHEFGIHSASRAVFSGGRIDNIRSSQHVEDIPVGDPPVWVPDPHIEIFCRDHHWNEIDNILTGTWFDDSTFSIYLDDVDGYNPVFENIFFTPEPTTLLLITVGGLLLRRRKYHM